MFIKPFILSIVLVAIVMLALSVKLLFDKNAKISAHSCAMDNENTIRDETCMRCGSGTYSNGSVKEKHYILVELK